VLAREWVGGGGGWGLGGGRALAFSPFVPGLAKNLAGIGRWPRVIRFGTFSRLQFTPPAPLGPGAIVSGLALATPR